MIKPSAILVVDDDHSSLKLLTDILTAQGYHALPADSGELALASVAAKPPELILLDIQMPGIDGFEVIRRLKKREDSRDIPIIVVSAITEVQQRVEGLKLGAADFITKPIHHEELLARVHTHLELSGTLAQLEERTTDLLLANEKLQGEIAERKRLEEDKENVIVELRKALAEVKQLSGFLPICASCKKIRDDKGYWQQIEAYISDHSEAQFSHGICPDCMRKLYPEIADEVLGHLEKAEKK